MGHGAVAGRLIAGLRLVLNWSARAVARRIAAAVDQQMREVFYLLGIDGRDGVVDGRLGRKSFFAAFLLGVIAVASHARSSVEITFSGDSRLALPVHQLSHSRSSCGRFGKKKFRIDVFYHRFGNGIPSHTARAPL